MYVAAFSRDWNSTSNQNNQEDALSSPPKSQGEQLVKEATGEFTAEEVGEVETAQVGAAFDCNNNNNNDNNNNDNNERISRALFHVKHAHLH